MKLIKYDSNWADEFDISGWTIMSDKEYEKWEKAWKNTFKTEFTYRYCIGTNEEIEYESFDEFISEFEIIDISDADVKVLEKFFITPEGFFPGS